MNAQIDTPPSSPLACFLGEILDNSVDFEIQNDNAKLPPSRNASRRPSRNLSIGSIGSRIEHKCARWETEVTNNDFIAMVPRRRKVYCEPEKMRGYHAPEFLTAPMSLSPRAYKNSEMTEHSLEKTRALTSELLGEALTLLSSDGPIA